jgi:hypothetical protein
VNIIHGKDDTKDKKPRIYRGPQTQDTTIFLLDPTSKLKTQTKHSSSGVHETQDKTNLATTNELSKMAQEVEDMLQLTPQQVPSPNSLEQDLTLSDDSDAELETMYFNPPTNQELAKLSQELDLSDDSSDDEAALVPKEMKMTEKTQKPTEETTSHTSVIQTE